MEDLSHLQEILTDPPSCVKDGQLNPDLARRIFFRRWQLTQENMNITVLKKSEIRRFVTKASMRQTHRGELQAISEKVHQDAPNPTLLALECPSLMF
jgi:hypothetical protein